MNNSYAMEKIAQQRLDEAARAVHRSLPDQTTPQLRRTFQLPRVAWHRQAVHPA